MIRKIFYLIAIFSLILAQHAGVVVAAIPHQVLRTVALTGQSAPGTSGGKYGGFGFGIPAINSSGNTSFVGFMQVGVGDVNSVNNGGLWSEGSGQLKLVARSATAVFGSGVQYSGFSTPPINSAGKIAFSASFRTGMGGVTDANDSGIFTDVAGSLALIAREGFQAPGTSTGAIFDNMTGAALNDAGQIAFRNVLKLGGGGVTTENNEGIWYRPNNTLELLIRKGMPAPGVPAGGVFSLIGGPVLNDSGDIAFRGDLRQGVGDVTSANNRGIWSNRTGSIELVIREGSQAAGLPPGAILSDISTHMMDSSGRITFFSQLQEGVGGVTSENDSGLWTDSNGQLQLVIQEGDQAPGTPSGTQIGIPISFVVNGSGDIAFRTSMRSGFGGVNSNNDAGVWAQENGQFRLVAREGDHPPGTPIGTEFFNFEFGPTLNEVGQAAFLANLRIGSSTIVSSTGLFATDQHGELKLIARTGDTIEVQPGDFRLVEELAFFMPSGNSDGRASGLSDRGEVVFRAEFTNGTSGIFVSSLVVIPEPESLVLATVCIIMGLAMIRNASHGATKRAPIHRG